MAEKLIPATQLAEYVFCSQGWYLKLHGAQVSTETRGIQAQANAWHEEPFPRKRRQLPLGSLCRRTSCRGAVPLLLAWLVAMIIVLVLTTTLLLLAAFLLFAARRCRRETGIPSGEIFYQDLVGQPFEAKVLRSSRWGISGKPDCLIRTPDGVVPVELKKSNRPPARGGVYPSEGSSSRPRRRPD
jgi:hypothetical protein